MGADSIQQGSAGFASLEKQAREHNLEQFHDFICGSAFAVVIAIKGDLGAREYALETALDTAHPIRDVHLDGLELSLDERAHKKTHKKAYNSSRLFLDDEDGQAIQKTLDSFGYPKDGLMGVQIKVYVDGIAEKEGSGTASHIKELTHQDLRQIIEIVDPYALIALDKNAAEAIACAFDAEIITTVDPVTQLEKKTLLGRLFIDIDDMSNSIHDHQKKLAAWAKLKSLDRRQTL